MGIETALLAGAVVSGGAALLDNKNQKKAVKSAERQRAESQAFIEKQINNARSDIFKLYPSAQDSRKQGLQAGLDLYGQAYPQMQQLPTAGNVGAQNALIQGLPQANNAITGNPVDLSGMQAVQLPTQGLTPTPMSFQGISGLGLTGQPTPQQLAQNGGN